MDGTAVRVQHGFSFWIFSGGVSHGLTKNHLAIDRIRRLCLGQRANGSSNRAEGCEGETRDGEHWHWPVARSRNWHSDEHDCSIKVETGSHYRQECIVMRKCRGFALFAADALKRRGARARRQTECLPCRSGEERSRIDADHRDGSLEAKSVESRGFMSRLSSNPQNETD
jgi:hypothetical protein